MYWSFIPRVGCFLPGSQVGPKLLARGFRTHAERHDEEGATNGSNALPQEAMPNHVKMAIPAGSAFMFDSSVWHTCEPPSPQAPKPPDQPSTDGYISYLLVGTNAALPNTSGLDRRTVHFAYSSSQLSSSPQWGPTVGLSEKTLFRSVHSDKLDTTHQFVELVIVSIVLLSTQTRKPMPWKTVSIA